MCESVSSASVCSSSGPFMTPKPVCPSCILISHHSFQCHPEYSASFFTATSISAFCWNYFLSPPAVFHKAPAHAIFRLLSCPFSDHSSYFPLFSPQYFSFIWVIVFHWFLIFFFCAPLLFVFCFLFHFSFTSVSWTTLTANDRRPHSVKWRAFNNWGSASLAMKLGQRWRQRVMTYVPWIFLFLTLFFPFFPFQVCAPNLSLNHASALLLNYFTEMECLAKYLPQIPSLHIFTAVSISNILLFLFVYFQHWTT